MDLNHIELPFSTLTEMYHSSLVIPGNDHANIQPELPQSDNNIAVNDKFLGENKQHILMLVNYTHTVHLPDNELNFLINMLGACKLSLADVAIINLNNYPVSKHKEITLHFKSSTVFLFGVDPAVLELPINFPHFQIQSFSKRSYLFTPSLSEIENDKVIKSKLWVCLRRMFNV
jgi:hypothetical protein